MAAGSEKGMDSGWYLAQTQTHYQIKVRLKHTHTHSLPPTDRHTHTMLIQVEQTAVCVMDMI